MNLSIAKFAKRKTLISELVIAVVLVGWLLFLLGGKG